MRWAPLIACCAAACGRVGFDATVDARPGGEDARVIDAESLDTPIAPRGPIAFVQANAVENGSDTITASYPANVAAGDLLVVPYGFDTLAASTTISDSQANLFVTAVGNDASEQGYEQLISYAIARASGPDTVTITLSSRPQSFLEIFVLEYTGNSLTAPFDVGSVTHGNSTGGEVSGAAVTTRVDDAVLVGLAVGGGAIGVGSNLTLRCAVDGDIVEEGSAALPGTYAVTANVATGADWTISLAAFH